MGRYRQRRLAWLQGSLLAMGLAAALVGGWAAGRAWAQPEHEHGGHEMHEHEADEAHRHAPLPAAEAAAKGILPGESIYNLESTWTDQDSARVPIAALKGKARLVAMFYTNCQYVCPLIVEQMKLVEREIPERLRGRIGYALFSFDPERDTPQVLKAYEGKRGLDGRSWRLYTGNPDEVLELAAVLGVRYRKEPDGDFSHSAIITVLDRDGVIRYQMLGLDRDRAPLVKALRAAAEG